MVSRRAVHLGLRDGDLDPRLVHPGRNGLRIHACAGRGSSLRRDPAQSHGRRGRRPERGQDVVLKMSIDSITDFDFEEQQWRVIPHDEDPEMIELPRRWARSEE